MAKIPSEIIEILRRYLNDVEKICHVDKAFIFGSYAHGRAGKHSDIDMAIFSRNVNDGNRLEIMTEAVALINKFKLDIQPLVFSFDDYFSKNNDFISTEIIRDGFELTEATH